MPLDFLKPVSKKLLTYVETLEEHMLGQSIWIHSGSTSFPELKNVDLAIVVVKEARGADTVEELMDFDAIRSSLYTLYPGNWTVSIADFGTIEPGKTIGDTYYLVEQVMRELLKNDIIPVIIGGSQDIAYYQYRAFDILERMVNLVNVDAIFDLGNASAPLTSTSYIGKIIIEQPYNLFNYSNIGYQTYYNAQDKIDLIEKLYFDAYRLGDVINDLTLVEPVMRDADIVSVDMKAVQKTYTSNAAFSPNGFNSREICAITRYAGISDKVKSFSIFECYQKNEQQAMLISQMLWYFIEGLNYRTNELNIKTKKGTLHYNVPVEDEVLSFYQSPITKRWWIEIPFLTSGNNKLKRHTLLPCTYNDYERACNQEIPERWYKAKLKNEV